MGAGAQTSNGILANVSDFSAVGVRDDVLVFSVAVVDGHVAGLRPWSRLCCKQPCCFLLLLAFLLLQTSSMLRVVNAVAGVPAFSSINDVLSVPSSVPFLASLLLLHL